MTEGIDTKRQNEYEPDVTPGELAADFSADPEIHGHHHLETSSLTLLRILNVDTSSEGTESNYEDQNLIHLAFCLKV
ncbi:MAG: hypothetical protein ABSC87_08205 [Halobacteriota archaeon]